jgi:hypothetical protein
LPWRRSKHPSTRSPSPIVKHVDALISDAGAYQIAPQWRAPAQGKSISLFYR